MSQPDPGAVHVNRPLTNFSHNYMQELSGFVHDAFSVNMPVDKQTDSFFKYPKGFNFRDAMQKRAVNAESRGIGYDVTTDTYACDVWALHHDIPDQVRANEDSPLNSDRSAAEMLGQLAMVRREIAWADVFLATANWTRTVEGVNSGATADTSLQWDDTSSTPIKDVKRESTRMQLQTGVRPNIMVVGREVQDWLEVHPEFLDRVKYGQTGGGPAEINNAVCAKLFGVSEYRVMDAVHMTSNEGAATDVMAFVGGKKVLLGYKAPGGAQVMRPTAAATFSWRGLTGTTNMGHRVKKFRMEQNGADRVEIEMAFGHKIIAADLATLFYTVVP